MSVWELDLQQGRAHRGRPRGVPTGAANGIAGLILALRQARVVQEGTLRTVTVTRETAACARHSLRFTDAAGPKHTTAPSVIYPLDAGDRILHVGFDLRREKGAGLLHEWRDDLHRLYVDPSLRINPEG